MSKHDLQKENLDRIGRGLLEATRVKSDELEKIIHAPHLFDSVKARIKAEQKPRRKAKAFFFVWNLQTASASFAILIVVLAVAAVLISRAPQRLHVVEAIKTPAIEAPVPEVGNSSPVTEITKTKATPIKNPAVAEKVDFKAETPNLSNRAHKQNSPKQAQSEKKQVKDVFYPLAFGGNWEADGEDLRIVRAELSRAELFALGVNLPVENESAKIKTDLLVGADGVARAIRLVE